MIIGLQVLLGIFSVIATGLAAYATWAAPRSAAQLAEGLRSQAQRQEERRRLKLHVFASIMQNRATVGHELVQALNIIDVVYHDCKPVREAWSELFLSYDSALKIPPHVQDERMRKMLIAMANDLGLGDELRNDDFGRVYTPNVLAEENRVRDLERKAALARLSQEAVAPTANTATPLNTSASFVSPYPERPQP